MKAINNNKLHRRFIRLFSVILLSLFISNSLQAQTNSEDLWGTWSLDTIEITKNGVSTKHSIETLLKDRANLPRHLFTQLYFFDNQIGVHSTESEFGSTESQSFKGSYTTDNGKLIVTMREGQPRTFAYILENEILKIWYTRGDTQFYLVYKLIYKNVH